MTIAPSRLMVLLFTDIVRSVDLKTRLGDTEGGKLIGRHDEIFRQVMGAAADAQILKDTGDGFLAQFTTTREAVMVALRFQHAIWSEPWGPNPIQVRVGIHLGEVSGLDIEPTGLPKLSGLAVDIAARVMGLGMPGQILMTRAAFDNARQYVRHVGDGRPFEWIAHGRYLFQGADEAMEIFEVGALGIAPLSVPPDGDKARRSVAAEDEETLGWRPASSLPVPGRKGWVLDRKLGEGGFGEVWLANHRQTKTRRVFKFCYDADRLRSLKREMTLFRVIREALGERPDIARLYEVQLDEPPFYLESEFTKCGNLQEWAETLNGIADVPLEARVELVARTARAAAAAHSVGILHKDIKPANILIYEEDGVARPRLSDFGIGMLTDKAQLAQRNITVAGFTIAGTVDDEITTGTRMYAPPELLAGKPFTVLGDVYALGVLLYQMVVGDLERPLAQGWERDVRYPLLREDIAVCVEGDEQQRLGSAQGLAKRLESLPQRRRARRRRNILRVGAAASSVLAVLLTVATVWGFREVMLRERAETETLKAKAMLVFLQDMLSAANPWSNQGPDVKVVDVLDGAAADLETRFDDRPAIKASLHATLGWTYKKLGWPDKGEPHLERALRLQEAMDAPPAELAQSVHELAAVKSDLMQYEQAVELYRRALAMRQELIKRGGDPEAQLAVAETTSHLATCLDRMESREEAERFYREALHIRELLPAAHRDGLTMWGSGISWVYIQNNLATCLREQGKFDEAEGYFREVVHDLLPDAPSPPLAGAMGNLAKCLVKTGDLDEAQTLLTSAVAMKREVLRPDDRRLAISLHDLGSLHLQRDAPAEAEPLLREALKIRRARFTAEHKSTAETASLLGDCLLRLDRLDEAEVLLAQSYPVLDAEYGSADERAQHALQQLIDVYERLGRTARARALRPRLVPGQNSRPRSE